MDLLNDKNIVDKILGELNKLVKVPTSGFLAGGAVANVLLGMKYGANYPINDLDIFVEKGEDESYEHHNSPVRSKDITVTQDGYSGILRISNDHGSQYQIASVERDGLLNYIKVTRVSDRTNIEDYMYILKGFDINCCQVGINLSNRTLTYTPEFEEFLNTKQLKVSTIYTPSHTAIRLFKKIDELDCYCDVDYCMELLSQPLIYTTRRFLNPEDFGFFFGKKYKEMYLKYFSRLKEYFTLVRFFDFKKEMWYIKKDLQNKVIDAPQQSAVHWLDPDRTIPQEHLLRWSEYNDKIWTLKPKKYCVPDEMYENVINSQPIAHTPITITNVFNIVRGSIKKNLKDKVLRVINGEGYLTLLAIRDIKFCDCDFSDEHVTIVNYHIEDYNNFFPLIMRLKLNLQECYNLCKVIQSVINKKGEWFGCMIDTVLGRIAERSEVTFDTLCRYVDEESENHQNRLVKPTDIGFINLPSDVRVRELVMEMDLLWAGRKLKNCIGDSDQSYKSKIESGKTKLFLISTKKSTSALELTDRNKIFSKGQHYATCNSKPSQYHTIISDILLNALNYQRGKDLLESYKSSFQNSISLLGTVKDSSINPKDKGVRQHNVVADDGFGLDDLLGF
jgi:hypothetical protein